MGGLSRMGGPHRMNERMASNERNMLKGDGAMGDAARRRWLSSEFIGNVPGKVEAVGELRDEDGSNLAYLSFSTERDIITDIGVTVSADCPEILRAALAATCSLAHMKAVMAADLINPDDVMGQLEGEGGDDEYFASLMAILTLKNALASYADHRRVENAGWNSGDKETVKGAS